MEFKATQSPQVDVVLVDYGDIVSANIQQLFPIEARLCLEPAIGMVCGLKNLEPLQDETWEFDATTYFLRCCQGELTAVFHNPIQHAEEAEAFSEYQSDFCISLQTTGPCGIIDIATSLVSHGYAKLVNNYDPAPNPSFHGITSVDTVKKSDAGRPFLDLSSLLPSQVNPAVGPVDLLPICPSRSTGCSASLLDIETASEAPTIPHPSVAVPSVCPPALPGNVNSTQLNVNAPEYIAQQKKPPGTLQPKEPKEAKITASLKAQDTPHNLFTDPAPHLPQESAFDHFTGHPPDRSGPPTKFGVYSTPASVKSPIIDDIDLMLLPPANPLFPPTNCSNDDENSNASFFLFTAETLSGDFIGFFL